MKGYFLSPSQLNFFLLCQQWTWLSYSLCTTVGRPLSHTTGLQKLLLLFTVLSVTERFIQVGAQVPLFVKRQHSPAKMRCIGLASQRPWSTRSMSDNPLRPGSSAASLEGFSSSQDSGRHPFSDAALLCCIILVTSTEWPSIKLFCFHILY